eukprot:5752324-Heterocapsa_arctica.AAC.1
MDIKQVIDPLDGLAGRAGALRVCHCGIFDFCILGLYFPASVQRRDQQPPVIQLWQWAAKVLQNLPLRCVPIIMTDANAHVGKTRRLDQEDFEGVGPHGAEQDNWCGRQFHSFVNEHRLICVKTYRRDAAGPTY